MFVNYQKGEIARVKVILRAIERGFLVSTPLVEARYDLIVDTGKKLLRAQVKYAGFSGPKTTGSVIVDLRKQTWGSGNSRTYSKNEVDVILVYIPYTNQVVGIPPDLFDNRPSITLRYQLSKNRQGKRTHLVSDLIW